MHSVWHEDVLVIRIILPPSTAPTVTSQSQLCKMNFHFPAIASCCVRSLLVKTYLCSHQKSEQHTPIISHSNFHS